MSVAQRLEQVRNQIADACARAHRPADSVALMAVSKTHPAEALLEAVAAGQTLFGENRVQEWQAKSQDLATNAAWSASGARVHLIGALQNNKTARAARLFAGIDSIDSEKTASRLNDAATSHGAVLPVLVEVKLSAEDAKHGAAPVTLEALLAAIAGMSHLALSGLMTVPPFFDDAELTRPYFAQLRALRETYAAQYPQLTALSMGMSHDFRVAIEEGSTCVRIGTAIFGAR